MVRQVLQNLLPLMQSEIHALLIYTWIISVFITEVKAGCPQHSCFLTTTAGQV